MRTSKSNADSGSTTALTHCYLCGRPLSEPTNKDHFPPRALFAREIRRRYQNIQLQSHIVHKECNESYTLDEEYFKETMVPFAPGSEAGNAIYKQFELDKDKKQGKRVLAESILREFDSRPSGLYLPHGKVIKRQDGDAIKRVSWKIVRGLYFHHHNEILPKEFSCVGCTLTAPGERPPEHLQHALSFVNGKKHGRYPGVFDYLFCAIDTDAGKRYYWAFLIWDRVIITVYFHDPWSCQCEFCIAALAELKDRLGDLAI